MIRSVSSSLKNESEFEIEEETMTEIDDDDEEGVKTFNRSSITHQYLICDDVIHVCIRTRWQ